MLSVPNGVAVQYPVNLTNSILQAATSRRRERVWIFWLNQSSWAAQLSCLRPLEGGPGREAGTGFLGDNRSDSFGSGLAGAGVVCRGRFAATRARGVIRAFLPLSVTRGADDTFAVLLASRTCAIRK